MPGECGWQILCAALIPPCSCLRELSLCLPFRYSLPLGLGEASASGSESLAKPEEPLTLRGCGKAVSIRSTEGELTMHST